MGRKRFSLDYEPEPYAGAYAPTGASADARSALAERGLAEAPRIAAHEARPEPPPPPPVTDQAPPRVVEHPKAAPPRRESPPPAMAAASPPRPLHAPRSEPLPRRHARSPDDQAPGTSTTAPSPDGRFQRTMRFTELVDGKLKDLSRAWGVDLNAAVSVAVAEAWERVCAKWYPPGVQPRSEGR